MSLVDFVIDTTGARQALAELETAIDQAARIALSAAVKATEASVVGTGLYQNKTGETRASVKTGFEGYEGFVESGGATIFLENGTKDHGPKNAKFLRFKSEKTGGWVFCRWVRGIQPRPFMRVAQAEGQEVANEAGQHYADEAIKRHG